MRKSLIKLTSEELMGYYDRGVYIRDIAKIVGCTRRTIERWNDGYGITGSIIGYVRHGICPVCGDEFTYWRAYNKKYCSNKCWRSVLNTGGSYKKVEEDGGFTKQTYLKRARNTFKRNRTNFRFRKGYTIHHLDLDITNNSPDNLFVFRNHSLHSKYHHAKRSGREWELRDKVDGFYCVPRSTG